MTDRVFLWAGRIEPRWFVRYFWDFTTRSVWVGISGGLRAWQEPRQFQPSHYGPDLKWIHRKIDDRLNDGKRGRVARPR